MKRAAIALALLIAVPVAAYASAPAQSPEDFLASIYSRYVPANADEDAHGIPLENNETIHAYFTPDVADMIIADGEAAQKKDEVPALDGDPFLYSQEWDAQKFDIKARPTGAGKADAHVKFVNYGEPMDIEYSLLKTPEGWRIDDIKWGGEDGTLRGLYAEAKKDKGKDAPPPPTEQQGQSQDQSPEPSSGSSSGEGEELPQQ